MKPKTSFITLITLITLISAPSGRAQFDIDQFAGPQPIVLASPQCLAAALTTNGPIDTRGYIGVATILAFEYTNAVAASTNFYGVLPEVNIGLTNLPVTGKSFTIFHNGASQTFEWTNAAPAVATDILIGGSAKLCADALCDALGAASYSTNRAGVTNVLIYGATNDAYFYAYINATDNWASNNNFTVYTSSNITAKAGTATTATIELSSDTTNWVALTNYALATSTTISYTNWNWGSSNVIASDTYLMPGVYATPTSATAGYSTPLLVPALYTNSAALTMTSGSATLIAYHVPRTLGYVHIIWAATGAPVATNAIVGALFNGIRSEPIQ